VAAHKPRHTMRGHFVSPFVQCLPCASGHWSRVFGLKGRGLGEIRVARR
jgi:hypothetical protein